MGKAFRRDCGSSIEYSRLSPKYSLLENPRIDKRSPKSERLTRALQPSAISSIFVTLFQFLPVPGV